MATSLILGQLVTIAAANYVHHFRTLAISYSLPSRIKHNIEVKVVWVFIIKTGMYFNGAAAGDTFHGDLVNIFRADDLSAKLCHQK